MTDSWVSWANSASTMVRQRVPELENEDPAATIMLEERNGSAAGGSIVSFLVGTISIGIAATRKKLRQNIAEKTQQDV